MTSFKARGEALKYARLLKIGILALDQPGKGNFIVSKFEYSMCIGSRPFILKTIYVWRSHLSGSYNFMGQIIYMSNKCIKNKAYQNLFFFMVI